MLTKKEALLGMFVDYLERNSHDAKKASLLFFIKRTDYYGVIQRRVKERK